MPVVHWIGLKPGALQNKNMTQPGIRTTRLQSSSSTALSRPPANLFVRSGQGAIIAKRALRFVDHWRHCSITRNVVVAVTEGHSTDSGQEGIATLHKLIQTRARKAQLESAILQSNSVVRKGGDYCVYDLGGHGERSGGSSSRTQWKQVEMKSDKEKTISCPVYYDETLSADRMLKSSLRAGYKREATVTFYASLYRGEWRGRNLWVHSFRLPADTNATIKMEGGVEDYLHIEFEYNKSKASTTDTTWHLKDVIVGKIYFLYNESETITKFEIMDRARETIPFLGGFDLTPTFRDINKKFSTRYYLNLVLIDEENLLPLPAYSSPYPAPPPYIHPLTLTRPVSQPVSHPYTPTDNAAFCRKPRLSGYQRYIRAFPSVLTGG
ncbi:vacuolar protein sorting-associated protein 26-domain-containing protein [Mycena rebaudengoi]|nr:vacuolar protein sorting-associated protein 26-domain-containing protein [Mycena rebaudengoi]